MFKIRIVGRFSSASLVRSFYLHKLRKLIVEIVETEINCAQSSYFTLSLGAREARVREESYRERIIYP